ncbi:MAG TPA: hypothetical protein VHV55_07305 [Pirellulales bacterium]|jgi:hypothetical protein|nr:hypothetical protein [Pirellulales bacterium]
MYYLYGSKTGGPQRLVATFDAEAQLLAYVRWATLAEQAGTFKFEQGSALASFQNWKYAESPVTDEDSTAVLHNPSPSML